MYASQATVHASADGPLKAYKGDPGKMASAVAHRLLFAYLTRPDEGAGVHEKSAESCTDLRAIMFVYFKPATESRSHLRMTNGPVMPRTPTAASVKYPCTASFESPTVRVEAGPLKVNEVTVSAEGL
ncbi:hypothetical protein NM688_g4690 [Phlebia brevispora]|uniref:Uncharacterized protein n=1 Tax=Phlebia brevispora TaxID=194682 RepID=A0ACC1T288_9APHY|nr:hypothetical protein NM688_g4690 [Phlebia brevispora]